METLTTSIAICSTCNHSLNVKGECLACLLRGGLNGSVEESAAERGSLVFSDFEIARREDGSFWELGCGAMGVTYRATDKVLHRTVALKVIETPADGDSQAVRERFLREARAAAALKHPNVAGIFQFGASPEIDRCYYAMELVEGETLEALVRRDGPLKAERALEIAIQVTRALVAAAAQGLIHRDLKPGNIMITRADAETVKLEVKVIDFGLAKVTNAVGEADLTHGGFVGTPSFASPEQFGGAPADARSDIYSLGVTFWYSLTGQLPYPGRTIEEIRDRQQRTDLPIEQLVARRVPAPLIKMLRRTLAIDPTQRPASARELMETLESCRTKLVRRSGIWSFWKLAAVVVVLGILTAAAGWIVWKTEFIRHPLTTGIAVLPFENLSDDPDNAYFANGIQEEILTRLASIADLKVISRTSTQQYQSKPRNLREIAKQLGVANILEGSVQKAADQVRVNVQLVNALTDTHLWADTYDRKLTDIFGVESEIAKRIASSLQAKLTGREEQALALKPTNNPEAYDTYLRGLAFEVRSLYSSGTGPSLEAAGFYGRAVQLDPNFALAWAQLSRADAHIYFDRVDVSSSARGDAAKRALENAQKLAPDSPQTLLALGYYQNMVLRDYGAAKATFGRVSKMLPGNSEVLMALSRVARRAGDWDQSIAYLEEALALDPRNVELLINAAWTYTMLRQFPAALKLYDRALDITPNDLDIMAAKASIYQAQGNLTQAAKLLSEVNTQTPVENAFLIKMTQLRLERNHGEAVRLLQTRLAQFHYASEYDKANGQVALAFEQRLAGDTAGARVNAEQARNMLEQLYRDQADNEVFAASLSQAYAAMGERDPAIKLAERATLLVPRAKDRQGGPALEENLALIHTIRGENSRAISTLTKLLQTPYWGWSYAPTPVTSTLLRLDPIWDPLRGDPRFEKIVASLAPK
ncbi:MAG: hypothetical protein DMF35_06060 [Verrucomicrobia bacterium]|nr:MAG: hypothetical protein DMF35_06060 [Verrucomicrobiota bacterium]